MAWIVKLPATPRHPQTPWQVRYRDGTTQRSVGLYPTKAEAGAAKRAHKRGDHVAYSDQLSPDHASIPFGEYVTMIWSGACPETAPPLAQGTRIKLAARISPSPPPVHAPLTRHIDGPYDLGKHERGYLSSVARSWRHRVTEVSDGAPHIVRSR